MVFLEKHIEESFEKILEVFQEDFLKQSLEKFLNLRFSKFFSERIFINVFEEIPLEVL